MITTAEWAQFAAGACGFPLVLGFALIAFDRLASVTKPKNKENQP